MVTELYLVNDRWLLAPFQIITPALQNFYINLSPALKELPSILRQKIKSIYPGISRIIREPSYAEEQWLNISTLVIKKIIIRSREHQDYKLQLKIKLQN